jgi:nitric oxide reductase NorD protein
MEEHVGHLWDRLVTRFARRDYPAAAVKLTEIERPAAVLFRALGGDGGLRLAAAGATVHGARRTWRERLAGIGERVELAWRDGEALYLPETLAVFPERALNRDLYLWLAALAAADEDGASGAWFGRNQLLARRALDRYPGLRARYRRLVAAHLEQRPDPAALPADEAAQERALRAALSDPGRSIDWPAARRAPQPVVLWLHPDPPRAACDTAATDDDQVDPAAAGKRAARDRKRRQAERAPTPDGRDGLLLYRFEGMLSIGDYVRVNRGTEDEDGDGANADDFDQLALTRDARPAAGRVRFDLDLPAAENDDTPLGAGILLPEWDYRRQALRADYCRVQPLLAARAEPCALPERLRPAARKLRRQFEALVPATQWRRGQPDGLEPDLEAYVRHAAERRQGLTVATPNLYRDLVRGRRDLACLLLADLSLSTDTWVGNDRRVIDVIRDALYLFAEALSATGDRFALYGFSSRKRDHVRFHHLKGFNEAYAPAVRGRIEAIKPGYYTRMGAAIRQATDLLAREGAQQRLLLILTDGKPNDLDQYEGRYGIEDTRHAIRTARRAGLTPFCVTIDDEGADYLPHLFGAGHYVVIHRPQDLPRELPLLYARLTPGQTPR